MVANPAPVDGLLHQLMAFNFQQSFWWRRISQRPREVYYITIVYYYIVCNNAFFSAANVAGKLDKQLSNGEFQALQLS